MTKTASCKICNTPFILNVKGKSYRRILCDSPACKAAHKLALQRKRTAEILARKEAAVVKPVVKGKTASEIRKLEIEQKEIRARIEATHKLQLAPPRILKGAELEAAKLQCTHIKQIKNSPMSTIIHDPYVWHDRHS